VIRRLVVGILVASAVGALGQEPKARLGAPVAPPPPVTVRASPSDPDDEGRPPAAKLGTVSNPKIGEGPDDASAEERYNWGAPRRNTKATPASRNRDSDDEDNGGRGAKLRNPAKGRLTQGTRDDLGDPPVPGGVGGSDCDPPWWPGRGRDLQEFRQQFPTFGAEDRDRLAFQSDCAFDNFISPISNPFLAEDPRSLTELRPLYFYQGMPSSQPYFDGGHLSFLGLQGRAAFTDRFSVVVHKVGWSSVSPGNPLLESTTNFSEIWISPKFVFWRVPDTQTLASFGLQFQIPVGGGGSFQGTGGLGLVPYVSFGRKMGETDYGSIHLINVAGYHLGTSNSRTDYFFDSLHLDLDVQDRHTFYPTLEMNWFHTSTNGTARPFLFFEGRDFANIGARAAGHDLLTIAPGFRYRFTDYLTMGTYIEFPVVGTRDLFQYRFGFDLIWRY
jgi:hypothetical protein